MADAEIQYVSNESGEPTETTYLLKSETMKRRILEAKDRQQGFSLDEAMEKLGI